MNKILFSVGIAVFLLSGSVSHAQEEVTSESEASAPVVVEAPVVAAPAVSNTRSTSTRDTTLAGYMQAGVPIRVRQEQAFDANSNNFLEPSEIKAFFKSVYEESAKGAVKNTSDVLYWVDTNGDGSIDRSEASVLNRY